jgi:hypothetical protein
MWSGILFTGGASFVAVDKGGIAYVALGGFEVLDAPRAEMQALGDLTDREEAVARASDIVSPVELFLTGQCHSNSKFKKRCLK